MKLLTSILEKLQEKPMVPKSIEVEAPSSSGSFSFTIHWPLEHEVQDLNLYAYNEMLKVLQHLKHKDQDIESMAWDGHSFSFLPARGCQIFEAQEPTDEELGKVTDTYAEQIREAFLKKRQVRTKAAVIKGAFEWADETHTKLINVVTSNTDSTDAVYEDPTLGALLKGEDVPAKETPAFDVERAMQELSIQLSELKLYAIHNTNKLDKLSDIKAYEQLSMFIGACVAASTSPADILYGYYRRKFDPDPMMPMIKDGVCVASFRGIKIPEALA